LKSFRAPLDFIKIGVFDLWIGNMDRKPNNLNILLGFKDDLFDFHPIDHTAAFAYLQHKNIKDILLRIEPKNCILSTALAKSILKHENPKKILSLRSEILIGMHQVIVNLDFIFSQVPAAWGFNKNAKDHLKKFLSDKVRNETIANHYLSFIRS
jgi:hypothetical protein